MQGPFSMETRREILKRLLTLQAGSNLDLIQEAEIERIREIWVEDVVVSAERNAKAQRSHAKGIA